MSDDLLQEAKQVATRTGRSLTAVIEDALREALARQRQTGKRTAMHLPTVGGQGILPGVDLDDTAALLDLMERER